MIPDVQLPASPPTDATLYGQHLVLPMSRGDEGAMEMASVMAAIVHHSRETGYVDALVRSVFPGCALKRDESRQWQYVTTKLASWLRAVCRFTRDPVGYDMPRHVDQLVYEYATDGCIRCDCDDMAMLACAILERFGYDTAFVLASADERRLFHHVFYAARVRSKTGWHAWDPQESVPATDLAKWRRKKIVPLAEVARAATR